MVDEIWSDTPPSRRPKIIGQGPRRRPSSVSAQLRRQRLRLRRRASRLDADE
eukprot:COSAG03_NODE_4405_length_1563_cov_2.290984_1_plen_51_part_10